MIRLSILSLFFAASATAADFKPNLGPDHETITVTCGDVRILLRQASQWTPGRFDYKGHAMTTERSAYGTVFSFPDVGFIGTGHLENEPEKLQSLLFFADGKEIKNPEATIKCGQFRLERDSRIRGFHLHNTIEIRDNRIYETARVQTDTDIPLKLVYHFMHAWAPTCSQYLAGVDGAPGEEVSGNLKDTEEVTRKFYVQKPVDWFAIYEPESEQYAVSRLLSFPEVAKPFSRLWNVPGTYRKYYLQSFSDASVPAGFDGTWKMVTTFGSSPLEDWKSEAKSVSQSLAK